MPRTIRHRTSSTESDSSERDITLHVHYGSFRRQLLRLVNTTAPGQGEGASAREQAAFLPFSAGSLTCGVVIEEQTTYRARLPLKITTREPSTAAGTWVRAPTRSRRGSGPVARSLLLEEVALPVSVVTSLMERIANRREHSFLCCERTSPVSVSCSPTTNPPQKNRNQARRVGLSAGTQVRLMVAFRVERPCCPDAIRVGAAPRLLSWRLGRPEPSGGSRRGCLTPIRNDQCVAAGPDFSIASGHHLHASNDSWLSGGPFL